MPDRGAIAYGVVMVGFSFRSCASCWRCLPLLGGLLALSLVAEGGGELEERGGRESASARRALEERVGWYEAAPGERRLVTWSAAGGLLVVDFESLKSERPDEEQATRAQQVPGHRVALPPYSVEEIRYSNADTDLVATVFLPSQRAPHPAVVVIHGSGSSDRDNLWYLYHAHFLAEAGLAVVLPDKRGSGMSGGPWKTASFDDFAGDTAAAIAWLRRDDRFDPDRVGVVGMSQGGWIAPLVAAGVEVAAVVSVSGTTVTPMEQLRHETRATLRQQGMPESLEPAATALAVARKPLWWQKNGDFDPLPHWKALRVPGLLFYGADDEDDNVPVAASVERLSEAMRSTKDLEVEVFDGVGHGLMDRTAGHLLKAYVDRLVDFLSTHLMAAPLGE